MIRLTKSLSDSVSSVGLIRASRDCINRMLRSAASTYSDGYACFARLAYGSFVRASKARFWISSKLQFRSLRPGVILALCFLTLVGCEDEVNPFVGTELPFTVWGQINPSADTQAVRIFSIDPELALIPAEKLDAQVTIFELETGRSFSLADSLIALPGNDYRHVFWSVFDVQHGNTYRLEVERSDGSLSRSEEIKVPNPIEIIQVPPNEDAVRDIQLPVLIEGDPPSVPRIDVVHLTRAINPEGVTIASNDVVISYSGQLQETPEGLLLNIQLSEDFSVIRENYAEKEIPNGLICSNAIRLNIHVGNESWRSPVEVFDPNILVEPGTFSNIENGFGYFGAGYVQSAQWQILLTLLVRAGFNDCL